MFGKKSGAEAAATQGAVTTAPAKVPTWAGDVGDDGSPTTRGLVLSALADRRKRGHTLDSLLNLTVATLVEAGENRAADALKRGYPFVASWYQDVRRWDGLAWSLGVFGLLGAAPASRQEQLATTQLREICSLAAKQLADKTLGRQIVEVL